MLLASFIDDLQANGPDLIELIIAFEDAFNVMIQDVTAKSIVTVQDAVAGDYIKQNQKTKPWLSDASDS